MKYTKFDWPKKPMPEDWEDIKNYNKGKVKRMIEIQKFEELTEAKYRILRPGANKENVSIQIDTSVRVIYITVPSPLVHKGDSVPREQPAKIAVPSKYDIEKLEAKVEDGVITILIPVNEGTVREISLK